MATPNPLSTLPIPVPSDLSASQEYTAALDKIVKALEARAAGEPNLWNVAAQFLNPGRTGNFGEALGNVAASVGQDVSKAKEYEIPVAQMKAQLAQQKYGLAQSRESLNTLNQLYGGSLIPPAAASTAPTVSGAAPTVSPTGAVSSPVTTSQVSGATLPAASAGPQVGSDGGWLPDVRTVSMMIAANNGDARPVLNEIAKARMKLSEPTDTVKDLQMLEDPKVSPIVKMGIATKYLEGSVKPFDVRTATGTMQSNAFQEIQKLIPGILGGKTTTTAPSPATSTTTRPATSTTTRPAATSAAPADVQMFTTSDGFKVPLPSKPPVVSTPPGLAPGSSEALDAMKKETEQNREYMYRKDGPLDKARVKYEAANQNLNNFTNIINSVQNVQGGIAAVPLQTWDKLVDAFGFSSPDQYKRMIATGVVDKASKEIVTNELKAAFGGNPTEGERKYLNEAMINISDPKELILFAALTRKALAARDIARFEYLSQNIGSGLNAEKTFDAWYRKQPLSLFEPELKKIEPRIFGKKTETAPASSSGAAQQRRPVYMGNREIVPNSSNTGWVYKDDGTPVR